MWSCRFAWQAWHFSDIPTCFKTRQKLFCVAGAILLLHFQTMCCIFRGRRSTLDTSDVIFRGRRSTLDVSCCVFSANRIVSAARSGDKVQIPWQAWHFVTCHENRRKPRTKRRFCEAVAVPMGKPDKRVFFDVSHDVLMSFCVAGVALCDIPCVCEVHMRDPREAEVAVPVGKSQKRVFFDVSQDVLMSFCVAGVALCDIPRV